MRIKTLNTLLLLFLISSCSLLQDDQRVLSELRSTYNYYSKGDYIDHLVSLGQNYRENGEYKVVRPGKRGEAYLTRIYRDLVSNNELILDRKLKPKFYIVKTNTPFYFSLPDANFFISKGLIQKYIKNEDLLIAVMANQVAKSHLNLFEKKVIVPTGQMSTQRILSMTRIPFSTRIELSKLTYFILRRSDKDVYSYLLWLQTQNKSTLDFKVQVGDTQDLTKEEFAYKNFIIQQGSFDGIISRTHTNSSKQFYRFIKELRRL